MNLVTTENVLCVRQIEAVALRERKGAKWREGGRVEGRKEERRMGGREEKEEKE